MLSHLDVAPLDGLALRVDALALLADVFALLGNVSQHFLGYGGQVFRAQTAQVLGFEVLHIKHMQSVPSVHR